MKSIQQKFILDIVRLRKNPKKTIIPTLYLDIAKFDRYGSLELHFSQTILLPKN